jgi:hypothetical protein
MLDLFKITINAHLKHLGLIIDKDKCVWKDNIMLFSNTIDESKQIECLFYWLEGYSSCYDNLEVVV